jgi:hypothetical protein
VDTKTIKEGDGRNKTQIIENKVELGQQNESKAVWEGARRRLYIKST